MRELGRIFVPHQLAGPGHHRARFRHLGTPVARRLRAIPESAGAFRDRRRAGGDHEQRSAPRGHAAYAAVRPGRLGGGARPRRRIGPAARRLEHAAALFAGLDRGPATDAGHRVRAGGAPAVRLLAADGIDGHHSARALAGADQHHGRRDGRACPSVRSRADVSALAGAKSCERSCCRRRCPASWSARG